MTLVECYPLSVPQVPHCKFRLNQRSSGHVSRSPWVLWQCLGAASGVREKPGRTAARTSPRLQPGQLNFPLFHPLLFHLIISLAQKVLEASRVESRGEDQPEKMLQARQGQGVSLRSDGKQSMLG